MQADTCLACSLAGESFIPHQAITDQRVRCKCEKSSIENGLVTMI